MRKSGGLASALKIGIKAASSWAGLRSEFEFGFAVGGLGLFLAVEEIGEFEAEVAGVGGVGEAGFKIDGAGADQLFNFAVEILHAFGIAVTHGVEKRLAFALALFDIFAGAKSGLENFDDGESAVPVAPRKQTLRNDVTERLGEAIAHALLIFHREGADDALDGFGGVNGVERRKNQVAGFGRFEGDFDGFAIAHFADKDDFGSLTECAAKRSRKRRRIAVEFALVNGRFFVAMEKFDGVFNGEDVEGFFLVHSVDDGGKSGGFAGAGGAGDEDDAVAQAGDFLELGRQFQVVEVGNAIRNHAHDDGAGTALAEDVDAEAPDILEAVREVGGAAFLELLGCVLIFAEEDFGDLIGVAGDQAFEALEFQFDELAADFDLRGATGREDEVADVLAGFQHGSDELRHVEAALNECGGRRICGHGSPEKMIAMEQGTASGAREAWPVAALWVLPDFTGRGRESSGWWGTGRPIWLLANCKQGLGAKGKRKKT